MKTVLWSPPRLVQSSRDYTFILEDIVYSMWTSNFIVVMITALLSNGTAEEVGWEGSASLKSAAVAVRRVFDRHGQTHYSNSCSNTMAFTRSSSAISVDKGVRIADHSAIDMSDLKAEATECSSVKTVGRKPREQG